MQMESLAETASPTINDETWSTICEVSWQATSRQRFALHRRAGGRCKTPKAPYAGRGSAAAYADEGCVVVGCLDLFHDTVVATRARLQPQPMTRVNDLHRYAYRVACTVLADRKRSERVALGLPAKPGRNDGLPARVVEALTRRAESPRSGQWHVLLFTLVREFACSAGRSRADWPVEVWARRRAAVMSLCGHEAESPQLETSSTTAQEHEEQVLNDVRHILQVARDVLGEAWVHQSILGPLGAGTIPATLDDQVVASVMSVDELALRRWLRAEYGAARCAGLDPWAALDRSAWSIARRRPNRELDTAVALSELEATWHAGQVVRQRVHV